MVECKEYKKLTESKDRFRGLSLLSEEDDDPEDAIYDCTRHDPFISGGKDVEDDEYLHVAGKFAFLKDCKYFLKIKIF